MSKYYAITRKKKKSKAYFASVFAGSKPSASHDSYELEAGGRMSEQGGQTKLLQPLIHSWEKPSFRNAADQCMGASNMFL